MIRYNAVRFIVVDENGNPAIVLRAAVEGLNTVAVFAHKQGELAHWHLTSEEDINAVDVFDKQGEIAIRLGRTERCKCGGCLR